MPVAAVAQRLLVLGAVALLGVVLALGIAEQRARGRPAAAPAGVPVPGGGWYTALASGRGIPADARTTSCGLVLTARSLGVTHPVLPCGAMIVLRYGGETVLTEVIDNGLERPTRQLELTPALARLLGLDGVQRVEWRFAARPRT